MSPGGLVTSLPQRDGASTDLAALFAQMSRVRALNDEAISLQRQGVLPAFAPCTGQEAAQVGSAAALDPGCDFAFPTYREFGAMIALGVAPIAVLGHHRGYGDGGLFDASVAHVAPIYAAVGATALHAVGWAMGASLDGDHACALAYFGEGASSQGDLHEAMNFAAIYRAPVIFFCQNNGWAISTPARAQVAGGSVAGRAHGYGLPGVTVDGDDVEAVRAACVEAATRARDEGGATVIEALTYRRGPHATSDDPRRYRTEAEELAWADRDPITQTRARLLAEGLLDQAALEAIEREVQAEIAEVRVQLAGLEPPSLAAQLDLTYRDSPPQVRELTRAWLAQSAHA